MFVTHSMGGLLTKQLLGNSSLSSIVPSVRGVVFLATPHRGNWLASLPTPLLPVVKASPAVQDLHSSSPYLGLIDSAMKSLVVPQGHIRCLSFGEGKQTSLKGTSVKMSLMITIVPGPDANPGYGDFQMVSDVDHVSMPKPTSKQHQVYVEVLKFLKEALNDSSRR